MIASLTDADAHRSTFVALSSIPSFSVGSPLPFVEANPNADDLRVAVGTMPVTHTLPPNPRGSTATSPEVKAGLV